jgi:hypothetical protein
LYEFLISPMCATYPTYLILLHLITLIITTYNHILIPFDATYFMQLLCNL